MWIFVNFAKFFTLYLWSSGRVRVGYEKWGNMNWQSEWSDKLYFKNVTQFKLHWYFQCKQKLIFVKIREAVARRCSVRKGVLGNFPKFTGKHLCQSLFLNKVVGLRPATLLKKWLWHRCFPVNFVKFLRTGFFTEHLWWLLLKIIIS